jgi:hypothetical protein
MRRRFARCIAIPALLDEMARKCRAKKESMMTLDRYCDRLLKSTCRNREKRALWMAKSAN